MMVVEVIHLELIGKYLFTKFYVPFSLKLRCIQLISELGDFFVLFICCGNVIPLDNYILLRCTLYKTHTGKLSPHNNVIITLYNVSTQISKFFREIILYLTRRPF